MKIYGGIMKDSQLSLLHTYCWPYRQKPTLWKNNQFITVQNWQNVTLNELGKKCPCNISLHDTDGRLKGGIFGIRCMRNLFMEDTALASVTYGK
jgi:hypothetical protein